MTEPTKPYGISSRGITSRDVELAADALLGAGERPTIEKIREKIGRGSPNTINPILDAWWKRLSSRLDAGPAALHRLPESVAHVAEALWMQALDEGRRRADQELTRDARSAAQSKSDLEVRSHVLTLREGELKSRLESRDRDVEQLRRQIHALNLQARKDQATRDAQSRRITSLEEQLLATARASAMQTRRKAHPGPKPKPQTKVAAKPPRKQMRKNALTRKRRR
jgi:hypothetical protein